MVSFNLTKQFFAIHFIYFYPFLGEKKGKSEIHLFLVE